MPARRRLVAAALAAGATVLAVTALWVPSASAHAILLRTEPSPQTTVKTAPAAVRLHFSEPVEVAFGAVRVFDVDGRRVDSGAIQRADGNREVSVPVRLKEGTYTVTWRVTSADGHPAHGGFGFYVGNPSTISAVAVPADAGAGPLTAWGFGAVRFLWFAAFLAVVGMVAVRRWVWTPAVRVAGLSGSVAADGFRRRFRRGLPGAWVVLAATGVLVLVFQAATVSGLPVLEAARPRVLADLLRTAFGRLWLVQMALTAALGVPVLALIARRPLLRVRPPVWIAVLGVLAAGLALATALNGHARTLGRAGVMVPTLALHLLAVAVWVGGLGTLVVLARLGWRQVDPDDRPALLRQLVVRFSALAVVAVAVIGATGVVNAVGDFAAVSDLWRVDHGRVVAAKVVLLAIALALAARHRWRVPRQLAQSARARGAVLSFERSSAAELVVVAAAVALAAALVALVPGRSLALAAKGPVNEERRSGAYTVQLFIDPTGLGANQVHVTFVNARGLTAAEVAEAQVSLGPRGGANQPVAMRLISPGHFVGDTTFAAPGRYQLSVVTPASPGTTTTFDFRLSPKE